MKNVNPILKAHMENLGDSAIDSVTEEHVEGFKDGQELVESELEFDKASSDVDDVQGAVSDLTHLQEAQDHNIEVMETDKLPEGGQTQDGSEPIETNEAAMNEPLPSDENQVVDVIDEQIKNEEMVMESIASSLGFKATFGKSATSQMYAHLGIRTSKSNRTANMESRNAKGSKKAVAIQVYKSHCEGVGDTVKKLGAAAWEGIKKMIKAVIDFIRKISNNVSAIIKNIQTVEVKFEDIIKNPEQFKLSDVFKNGYTEISPASIFAGCVNPHDIAGNVLDSIDPSFEILKVYEEFGNTDPKDFAVVGEKIVKKCMDIVNSFKFKTLKFDGVEFSDRDTAGTLCKTGIWTMEGVNEAKSVNIKFSSIQDLAKRVKDICEAFDASTIKKINSEGDRSIKACEKIVNSTLDKISSMGRDAGVENDNGFKVIIASLRENLKMGVNQAKTIFQVSHTAVSALRLLSSGVEK